jgi:hypothetical protein
MSLPTVPLGPCQITRLIIGGNPFSGFSHQSPERDQEMLDYYTVERIKATLRQAEAAGINTCLMRTDAHICRMLREYRNEGGRLHWIAQNDGGPGFDQNLQMAVSSGAIGYHIHGALVDRAYADGDLAPIAEMIQKIKAKGILAGVAGHAPEAHLAIHEAGIPTDYHMVCLYNCGSLHVAKGDKFDPADPPKAVEAIRRIDKPCIAYKVLAAGRVPAQEGLRYAYANIKPSDMVCVGVYTRHNPRVLEEDARMAEEFAV